MAKGKKFYVVWEGNEPGIYSSWDACKRQIDGFAHAKYKSFPTYTAAQTAYDDHWKNYYGKESKPTLSKTELEKIGQPILHSITVDGAWNTITGLCEYQGRETSTGALLFKKGPFEDGTNNVVEFLAIVHALAMCQKEGWAFPIYSDSRNAIKWVKAKQVRTKLIRTSKNARLFELIDRAIQWLKTNRYNNPVLKWETKAWGENPADFGRK